MPVENLFGSKKIGYEGEMDTVTHLILDEEGYINLIHYLPATGDNFTLKSVNSNGNYTMV